ncbi:polysaccharide biosynthesis C-terminal domain-containing protein [Blastococcus sp. TF02A-30]|uniref:polysaccharide biosynthesis C-terminal domain-containing protein n=1 Tax=Blastococcus sp. TF02A-30 TaxID=2250580 RepID=UPI0011BEC6DE|nr:polysaccharide biosynthesis C-terminal domain-containing protein [Blastococcus sp. TF02A-30]
MAAPSDLGAPAGARAPGLPWRRMTSFAGLPLISIVGQLTLIPVIASVGGATGWAAVGLGQALGAGAATVLQYGWGFTGPRLLVPLGDHDRGRLLWLSMLSRLLVAGLVLPVTAAAAAVLAPDGHRWLAALTALGAATFGLSAFWYFVGVGRAGLAARYETVPRLVVLLGAALVVLLTQDVLWYAVIFLVGQTLIIVWLTARLAVVSLSRDTWAAALRALRTQRAAAATDVVVALTQSMPTSIVAWAAPGALATFSAGDRIVKLAQSGIQPLFNAFQGWVSEAPGGHMAPRMRLAVAATSTGGLLGGVAFAIGLPPVDRVLFAGEVPVGYDVAVWFGVVLALYALTSSFNFNVLAPVGRTGHILRSATTGAVVAILGVAALAHEFGAVGGAAGVALAQLSILAVQVLAWRQLVRERRAGERRVGPAGDHPLAGGAR